MQQNITPKKNITNETYTQKNTSNNNNKTDSKWMIQKRQHLKADEHWEREKKIHITLTTNSKQEKEVQRNIEN